MKKDYLMIVCDDSTGETREFLGTYNACMSKMYSLADGVGGVVRKLNPEKFDGMEVYEISRFPKHVHLTVTFVQSRIEIL